GAVDRAGGRLVLQRAGVGGDAPGRDRAAAQRPQETLVPVGALFRAVLGLGQGPRDALVGAVDVGIHRCAVLGGEPVLLVPDVLRGGLHRDLPFHVRFYCFQTNRAHASVVSSLCRPGYVPRPVVMVDVAGPRRRGRKAGRWRSRGRVIAGNRQGGGFPALGCQARVPLSPRIREFAAFRAKTPLLGPGPAG